MNVVKLNNNSGTDQNINYMADGNAAELVLQSLKTHITVKGTIFN